MLVPRPTCSHVGGAAPRRIAPDVLSLNLRAEMSQQQALLDLQAAQSIFNTEGLLGGIWLPDLAMMKQDSAGQTPAASGAVVGLVYDQSKGLALGPDLLVSGTFDDATKWSTYASSISNGVLTFSGVTYSRASGNVGPIILGLTYQVVINILSISSGGVQVQLMENGPTSVGVVVNSPGIKYSYITALANHTTCYFTSGVGGSNAVVDSLSVKEVYGNHASQPTTANKPTLVRFRGDKYWFVPNSSTTALTATFPSSLGSACTIFEAGINGVVKRTNQTIATTYNLAEKPWFGSIVLNRATTPYEDALFTRLLSRYSPKYQYNDTLSQWLFQSQEKGLILDCDDLPLMFQDASGVTPVTAMEQSVRLILDKSPNRVFARAESDAARPVVSARYNLLVNTENVSGSQWTKTGSAGTPNATTVTLSATGDYVYQSFSMPPAKIGDSYTYSVELSGSGVVSLRATIGGGFNLRVTLTSTPTRYSYTFTSTSNDSGAFEVFIGRTDALDTATTVIATKFDLRVTNDGISLPPYQRVTTATDYDTAGFPRYLLWNGSSSAMVTPTIDFTATDKATVWAGVRKLSDASRGVVVETSAVATGFFFIAAPSGANLATYRAYSIGTSVSSAVSPATFSAPTTNILSSKIDIGSDELKLNVNGSLSASSISDQGSGAYSNTMLYIGSRSGITDFLNGRIYSLIVRGAQTSDGLIAAVEQNVNSKTRAY